MEVQVKSQASSWTELQWGRFFSEVLWICPVSIIPPMLCTHHHHHHHLRRRHHHHHYHNNNNHQNHQHHRRRRLHVFLTEGQMGGAWEPFKLRRCFGNLKALDGKKIRPKGVKH